MSRLMVKRACARPGRLGTPRRKPKGPSCPPERSGGGPRRQARLLDSDKQLATTVHDHFKSLETKWDRYRLQCYNQAILLSSLAKIIELGLNDKRAKDYNRLHNCQREWIGFQASCCGDALAVPIGCNNRLCFLCNAHRAQRYRERVKVMFDRLEHPVFLTLTIPNVRKLSKRTYNRVRTAIRKLLKQHSGWANGGLYSLETTYNRNRKSESYGTWHVHAHVLIDSKISLPTSRPEFIRFKRRVEFDWLVLTGGRKCGWHPANFNHWFYQTESGKREQPDRYQWNRLNRRVIDIRRVTNREKAAYEVLKYITKASDFVDCPFAVEEFLSATKGTRMIQTFGSWYGFKFPESPQDWSHLECNCGANKFERMEGRLPRHAVYMDKMGRWRVRVQHTDLAFVQSRESRSSTTQTNVEGETTWQLKQ